MSLSTLWTEVPSASGGTTTRIAEDVLKPDGGILTRRGPIATVQNAKNDYDLTRQHMGGTGQHRPAPSVGGYPHALWVPGIGEEPSGYGTQDSGGGIYINLDRGREGGVLVTQSWWWGLKVMAEDSIRLVSFFQDTEAWRSTWRSYYTIQLDLLLGTAALRADNGSYPVFATNVGLPGWNDNKFDRTYFSLTTRLGNSDSPASSQFGEYICCQIGGKVYDLRGAGGGSANYETSPVAQPGSSFSGGRNPGAGLSTPIAGKRGAFLMYDFLETFGDSVD